jgi:hypothetical protein
MHIDGGADASAGKEREQIRHENNGDQRKRKQECKDNCKDQTQYQG